MHLTYQEGRVFLKWFVRLLDVFNLLSPLWLGFVGMSESYWFDMDGASVEVTSPFVTVAPPPPHDFAWLNFKSY